MVQSLIIGEVCKDDAQEKSALYNWIAHLKRLVGVEADAYSTREHPYQFGGEK